MANLSSPQFKFQKMDTIGAASAEDDAEFLNACFVETEEYEVLKKQDDIRRIVLGRTGSGKSALFERLRQETEAHVISIEPHNLALAYVSNSSVIRAFSDVGVNLDPFYKLLWRHVLTVEVLRRHFDGHADEDRAPIWETISSLFSGQTTKDKSATQAIQYLREWGENFWVETEFRVREITAKLEKSLEGEMEAGLKSRLLEVGASGRAGSLLSEEDRIEVLNRGQEVVSAAQVKDLGRVVGLLANVLSDKQKYYYILIDRLDEDWVEEKLRYRLIMALMDSLKEINRVPHVKVLVAIRRDLLDRVFRLVRETGFQEEKYQSLYLPLRWSTDDIVRVLDKRIDVLVTKRSKKSRAITHRDVLPRQIGKVAIKTFIAERAERPRDAISFFNKCIEAAEGKPRLNVDTVRRAEGEYSRQRLRALGDEWYADYTGLLDFTPILKNRPSSFLFRQVLYREIEELCLRSAIDYPDEGGILRESAKKVTDVLTPVEDFKRTLFMVFHRVGLIGLKLESFQSAAWVDEFGQMISPSEINDDTHVVVHTTYHRALGIRTDRRD